MKLRCLFALVPVLFVTGCGLVAAFIPPVEVADPFGMDGQSLTLLFGPANIDVSAADASAAALTPQAESQAQAAVTRTFDDQALDLRGFSLARLDVQMGFAPTASLARPLSATFPTSFILVRTFGVATLQDETNGEAVLEFAHDLNLVFTRDAACDLAALSCTYRYVGDEEALASALSVAANDRGTLRVFVDVVRLNTENTPNTGRFSVGMSAESEPGLDGFSATFVLRSGKATIKVGG